MLAKMRDIAVVVHVCGVLLKGLSFLPSVEPRPESTVDALAVAQFSSSGRTRRNSSGKLASSSASSGISSTSTSPHQFKLMYVQALS